MKLLAILLALFLMVGAAVAQDEADTLVYAVGNDIENFNTVTQSLSTSSFAQAYVFPVLYDMDINTGLPVNTGLSTWTISEDGLTYTFTIRPDANWSDGTPITANDVKFTFDAIAQPNVETIRKSFLEHISTINVIDDKTLEVVLTDPNCNVWNDLSTRIMPAHKFAADYSDFVSSEFNQKPDISGGPYLLDEWAPDEYIRFRANPDYWKSVPEFEVLVMQVIPDPTIVVQSLIAGDVDMAAITPEDAQQLQSATNVTIYTLKANLVNLMALNWTDPASPASAYAEDGTPIEGTPNPFFGDVRVRQAIAMGWDKDTALVLIGEGVSRLVGTISPAITWAFNDEVAPYPYDPEAAAALLDEAGWTLNADGIREKDGVPFEFELAYIPGNLGSDDVAVLVQDQLGQLGITVTLQAMETGALVSTKLFPQTFDALMISAAWDAPEPQVLSNLFLNSSQDVLGAGFNFTSYNNPEVDALLAQTGSNVDCSAENRGPLFKEIQKITHDDVAYDFISDTVAYLVFSNRIGNIIQGNWGFNDVQDWTVVQ
jgi:peptide/nickel transport system substrate-binding protein